jgi:cytoskeleton protein RodZ
MIEPVNELPVASVLALPIPNFAEDQQTVEINTSGYEVTVIDLPLSRRDLVYQQKVPTPEELAAEAAAAKLAAAESSGASQARRSNSQQAASSSNNSASQSNSATNAVAVQTINIQPTELATTTTKRNTNSASKIVFKVEKESWIDVRDNTGERLIYRTVNRGEDIRLDGQPPYSVFIGSIEGVSVEYKGKPIKFKAHESGLFARFEVGNQ